MWLNAISLQLAAKETVAKGVGRFGEIVADHVSILLIVDECSHPINLHKKVEETGPF